MEISRKLNAPPEPTLKELAQNDIKMAANGFEFEKGDLDFYFNRVNQEQLIWGLIMRLKEIKKAQGI